ncbi:cell division transport system permease protein [Actinoplanes derwentensis]|uniref:Cell division transport system permease protein n=2 Tax=Actinoplanes derwentensis TaxID=113562 RepID=A0A1H2CS69_9ACTN|nr:cell division transport system permease protein [Actinoplanes derwentensis]
MPDVGPWEPESEKTEVDRRWLRLFGVAAGALVLGSVASTTAMLIAGWRYAPEREFTVAVYLEPDAGTDQRDAVRGALARLPARDGVRLETREEAYAKFREKVSNDPEQLAGVMPEMLPESLYLIAPGRSFDCGPIPGIRDLSGVDRVRVVMKPQAGRWGAEIGC